MNTLPKDTSERARVLGRTFGENCAVWMLYHFAWALPERERVRYLRSRGLPQVPTQIRGGRTVSGSVFRPSEPVRYGRVN